MQYRVSQFLYNVTSHILEKKDNIHIFLTLCSCISICENRNINLANVVLLVIKEKKNPL